MTSLTRIQGYAHVAEKYGLEEAIFMDTIVHWYRANQANNRNFHEGRWWTYNTVKAFEQTFPWWSAKQIRRIIASCKDKGALLTCSHNKDSRDRTIWYSPSNEILGLYDISVLDNCNCPNGQMEEPERANTVAQTGEALPCNTHVGTNDPPKSPKDEKPNKQDLDEEARALLNEYVGKDLELIAAMSDMIENRKELKAVNSARAIKSLLSELDRLSYGSRANKLVLLRRAVASNWKIVYPLKPGELPDLPPVQAANGQAPPSQPTKRRYIRTEIVDGEEVDLYE